MRKLAEFAKNGFGEGLPRDQPPLPSAQPGAYADSGRMAAKTDLVHALRVEEPSTASIPEAAGIEGPLR